MNRRTALSALTLAAAAAAIAFAGDLQPPAGPVAPTGKTLTQVEPRIPISAATTAGDADSIFKITHPGSYYLTANITASLGLARHGIEVTASGVTIDLNGFDLNGSIGAAGFDGISATASALRNITVRNGSIRGWGDDGIDLSNVTGGGIEDVTASQNRGSGILLGNAFTVNATAAVENSVAGIVANEAAVLTGCTSALNGSNGISVGSGSVVRGCSARENGNRGIVGSDYCVIEGCAAAFNEIYGISTGGSCHIRGNQLSFNQIGIRTIFGSSRIEDNNCTSNNIGIQAVDPGNFIARNTCRTNGTNWDIAANNKCLVIAGTNSAAILGDSGGVSPGSTNPNANYTY